MEPDQIRKDVPVYTGIDVVSPDSETQRRFGPPNGVKPKWARLRLPLPPHSGIPWAATGVRGTTGKILGTFGMPSPTYPGPNQC